MLLCASSLCIKNWQHRLTSYVCATSQAFLLSSSHVILADSWNQDILLFFLCKTCILRDIVDLNVELFPISEKSMMSILKSLANTYVKNRKSLFLLWFSLFAWTEKFSRICLNCCKIKRRWSWYVVWSLHTWKGVLNTSFWRLVTNQCNQNATGPWDRFTWNESVFSIFNRWNTDNYRLIRALCLWMQLSCSIKMACVICKCCGGVLQEMLLRIYQQEKSCVKDLTENALN